MEHFCHGFLLCSCCTHKSICGGAQSFIKMISLRHCICLSDRLTKLFNTWRYFAPVAEHVTGHVGVMFSHENGPMIISAVKPQHTITFGECDGISLTTFGDL